MGTRMAEEITLAALSVLAAARVRDPDLERNRLTASLGPVDRAFAVWSGKPSPNVLRHQRRPARAAHHQGDSIAGTARLRKSPTKDGCCLQSNADSYVTGGAGQEQRGQL